MQQARAMAEQQAANASVAAQRMVARASNFGRFPPSDGLTKRRKCVSPAAACSCLALVQDRRQRGESGTKAECIHVGIWDDPQQGCISMLPPDDVTSGLASDFVYFAAR